MMFAGDDAPHNALGEAVIKALDAAALTAEQRDTIRRSLERVLETAPTFGDPVKDMRMRAMLAAQFHAAFEMVASGEPMSGR